MVISCQSVQNCLLRMNLRANLVAFFCHVGINSIRCDLMLLHSSDQRVKERNDMHSAFDQIRHSKCTNL